MVGLYCLEEPRTVKGSQVRVVSLPFRENYIDLLVDYMEYIILCRRKGAKIILRF